MVEVDHMEKHLAQCQAQNMHLTYAIIMVSNSKVCNSLYRKQMRINNNQYLSVHSNNSLQVTQHLLLLQRQTSITKRAPCYRKQIQSLSIHMDFILGIPLTLYPCHWKPNSTDTQAPYKIVQYLHIIYAHPPMYFEPPLDYLLQHYTNDYKYDVNATLSRCQHSKFKFCFLKLSIPPLDIFNSWLVESMYAGCGNTVG